MVNLLNNLENIFLLFLLIDLGISFYNVVFKPIKDYLVTQLELYINYKLDESKLEKEADLKFLKSGAIFRLTERIYTIFPWLHQTLLWLFLYILVVNLKEFL